MAEQRFGNAIAMTADERDAFLRTRPICRVATVGPDGRPHVSALWFIWDGSALWLNSLIRSRRWGDLAADPRCSVIVDEGATDFMSLCGVELQGSVEVIGEAPRRGEPLDQLRTPERLFADKYTGGGDFRYDGRHGWLRLTVETVVSWDFSKIPQRPLTPPLPS